MAQDAQSMYSYLTINSIKEIKSQVKRIKDQCQAKKDNHPIKNTQNNLNNTNYNGPNQYQHANALITKLTNNSPNVKVITREYKTNIKMKKFLNCLEHNVFNRQKRLLQQGQIQTFGMNIQPAGRKQYYSLSQNATKRLMSPEWNEHFSSKFKNNRVLKKEEEQLLKKEMMQT